MDDLKKIETEALERIQQIKTAQALAEVRSDLIGKKGVLTLQLRDLSKLPAEARPQFGQQINLVRQSIEAMLRDAAKALKRQSNDKQLFAGRYDVTLPGRRIAHGAEHPLRLIEQDVIKALSPLGFSVARGPLVEHDWYNFEALNIPPDHPSRDMQDTFFLAPHVVLRTHTSNVQIRTMLQQKPPVRILAPGMVFRNDQVDPTHSPVFHQIEGLWVDEKASFADLKGVLQQLVTSLFGSGARLRFRPSYFPFTEPSAEVDMSCVACARMGSSSAPSSACRICKGTGWLEILGAGMVDPAVFEAVGYDPEQYQGFAFGVGLERLAMLRWDISDIRFFYENDWRFLEQFTAPSI